MTSWPKHKNIFYKITSSSLAFEVKGPGNALIGLAANLHKGCEYWILIGLNNSQTCIAPSLNAVMHGNRIGESTPNILSEIDFKKFWLSWYGDKISLGRQGEHKPIVASYSCYEMDTKDLRYITFGVFQDRNSLRWKFELPPIIKQLPLKPISDGKMRWVTAENQLPDDALIGGYENEFLYIIRATHRGSVTPGKFVPSLGVGFISWGGGTHEKTTFEALCGFDCVWLPADADNISVDAIEAGFSEDRSERLYIGRAYFKGHIIPGKVQLSHRVCYIAYEEREIAIKSYEVLACPNANPHSARKMFVSTYSQQNRLEANYEEPNYVVYDDLYSEEEDQ